MASVPSANSRATRRAKTLHRIQEAAIRLFLAHGYEATTVQSVAEAAGVSHMTVFRYFPTKEALVLANEYDSLVAEAIRNRPTTEPALDSVERAVFEVMKRLPDADLDLQMQRVRLIMTTPALQAGLWVRWMAAQRLVAAALAERGGQTADPLALRVVAGIAYVTAATASLVWIDEGGRRPLTEVIAQAFAVARREFASTTPEHDQ